MVWPIFRPFTDFIGWTDSDSQRYKQVNFARSAGDPTISVDSDLLPQGRSYSVPVVWGAIRVLSSVVAGLPFELFVRKDEEHRSRAKPVDFDTRQYLRLLKRPNPHISQLNFMRATVVNLALAGNSYALIQRDRSGQWRGTIPVAPERVRIDYDLLRKTDGRQLVYRVNKAEGEDLLVSPSNMLHFKMFSDDGLMGLSPVEEARRTLGVAQNARDWAGKYMEKGGYTGGVLTYKDFLNADQMADIKAQFPDLRRNGYHNVGETVVLGGDPKFVSAGLSQRDSQFIETRKYTDEELAGIWGVPLGIINRLDAKSFYDDLQSLMFFGIKPYMDSIRDEFQQKLFFESDYEVDFVIQHLLYADPKTRAEYFERALGGNNHSGWMTQNQVRVVENFEPLPDQKYEQLTTFQFTSNNQANRGEDSSADENGAADRD